MKQLTIMIVDDAEINRGILRNIFDKEYHIIEAANGQEALDLLLSGAPIDVILLDIIMPVMDGMEFLRRIKTDYRYNEIPVIVNTVINEKDPEYEAVELGADDFIVKPYNPKMIYNKVTNILKKYVENRTDIETRFRNVQAMYNSLIEAIPGGVMICDITYYKEGPVAGLVTYNDAMRKMIGYQGASIVEHYQGNLFNMIDEEDVDMVYRIIEKSDPMYRVDCGEIRLKKADGTHIWTRMSIKEFHLEDDHKIYYQMIFEDIMREKINKKVLENSKQDVLGVIEEDPVTGLCNRSAFYTQTESMIRMYSAEEYIVVNYNIDNFKVLNELFGVKMGDNVLREFGYELKRKISDQGTIGRFESDHFYICVTRDFYNENESYFYDLAAGRIKWSRINYPILLHAGICSINSRDVSMASICDAAAMAVGTIKTDYFKRCTEYNDELKENMLYHQRLVNDMEKALDEEQFFVVFQPIYSAKTQKIESAEALVRWKHPKEGIISPGDFIPLFEENGFVSRLDMFVCEKVCQYQQKRSLENKEEIPISVNLSRVNFFNPEICSDIKKLIEKYGLEPSSVKFEITESVFKDNVNQISNAVDVFHDNGFSILMDDFGSGYSSLNMLKDIDMDVLKIDMKFMTDMEISERANNILFSIIQMAKGLNMLTVAEGVEKMNQYELLKGMGCDYIQGFLFSRPVSVEEFDEQIRANHVHHNENDVEEENLKVQTVLVVDDDEMNRVSISEVLSDDYNVIVAENGAEALEVLHTRFMEVNLVISDIVMPVMNGFEMLQNMNAVSYYKNIPVLMVTAFGEMHNEEQALNYGALDVINKPYDPDILKKRVANILRISESINIEQEVKALRENVRFKTQIQDIFVNGFAGMSRFEVYYDEELTIKNITFSNTMINELNGFTQSEAENLKSFYESCMNMNAYDRENVMLRMRKAIENKDEYLFNLEYATYPEERKRVSVMMSCSFQYYDEYVVIDIVAIENTIDSDMNMLQTMQSVIRDVAEGQDAIIWKYNIEHDVFEYPDKEGNIQIVENAKEKEKLYGTFMQRDRNRIEQMYQRLREGSESISEDFLVSVTEDERNSGNGHWIRLTYHRMYDVRKKCIAAIGVARNIEEKKNYENVRRLSRRDSLTGLYNRRTFENIVERLAADNIEDVGAFIMVDIDNFKKVNDNFGHAFGDTVIRSIGKLLSDIFRKDDIVARIGGDEFAVYIPNVKRRDAIIERAKEICSKSCMTFENGASSVNISCSVGITFGTENDKNFRSMYINADKAMYKAKKAGKNRLIVLD